MLTTLGEAQNKIAGLAAGADDYIEKPKGQEEFRVLCARNTSLTCGSPTCGASWPSRTVFWKRPTRSLSFELKLAQKVQLALIPRPPTPRGGLGLAVRYSPANQLGGDVYDIYRLDNNRLGILVADVSGHGVNSAMRPADRRPPGSAFFITERHMVEIDGLTVPRQSGGASCCLKLAAPDP